MAKKKSRDPFGMAEMGATASFPFWSRVRIMQEQRYGMVRMR